MLEAQVLIAMRRHLGFTLLELMVTLAVAAILATLAIPSMSRLLRESQASTAANDLVYAMRLARSEAVARKLPVAVCASAGTACSGNNDWEEGWLVFTDPNDDGTCNDADGDRNCQNGGRILHKSVAGKEDFSLSARAGSRPANTGVVVYGAQGLTESYFTTFSLCDSKDRVGARGFTVSASGRITPTKDPDDLDCA